MPQPAFCDYLYFPTRSLSQLQTSVRLLTLLLGVSDQGPWASVAAMT